MRTTHTLPYGGLSLRDPPDRDSPGQSHLPLDRDTRPWKIPPPWTESQTGVKTLPCRNFVAGGKNLFELFTLIGAGDTNALGMSTHAISHTQAWVIAPEPPSGYSTTRFLIKCLILN